MGVAWIAPGFSLSSCVGPFFHPPPVPLQVVLLQLCVGQSCGWDQKADLPEE